MIINEMDIVRLDGGRHIYLTERHQFGIILKGEWEFIYKNGDFRISPKIIPDKRISLRYSDFTYKSHDIITVALGMATSEKFTGKQLWILEPRMLNFYLIKFNEDTLLLVTEK